MSDKQCGTCKKIKPLTEFHRDKSKKDGHHSQCKECHIEYSRQYYKANKDKIRESGRQYREKNADKIRERNRQYYKNPDKVAERRERGRRWREKNPDRNRQWHKAHPEYAEQNREKNRDRAHQYRKDHPEIRRETRRRYYEKNKDKKREAAQQYYKENRDKILEYGRQWKKKNPGNRREWERRRRAKKRAAPGDGFTDIQFQKLCTAYDNRCLCCGQGDVPLAADHVIPLSRGGANELSNIQPLCQSCNSSKHTKSTDYR